MIEIKNPEDCCGCGACVAACPTKCISLEQDSAGFTFAKADATKCIACNRCDNVCPMMNQSMLSYDVPINTYAAYSLDKSTRNSGASGGMFGTFAKNVISKGGVVFGAAFDENMQLCCTSASTEEELAPLCKSKYIQCKTGDSFAKIKELLDAGIYVLYTSTPCCITALKNFLSKSYDNLLTVDFLCHGVPSQDLFDRCRDYVEKKEKIRINTFRFREKKKHSSTPCLFYELYSKNGIEKERTCLYIKSPFFFGFQKYLTLRDSCYQCIFSGKGRCSDVTIADFHEIEKYHKGINRFDGISKIIIHTERGEKLFSECKSSLFAVPIDSAVLEKNGHLFSGGSVKPQNRDEFVSDLCSKPFDFVVKKYLNGNHEYAKIIYYSLPTFIRKILKRFFLGD